MTKRGKRQPDNRLDFPNRARIRDTEVAKIRRWQARNAPIAIDEITSKYRKSKRYILVDTSSAAGERIIEDGLRSRNGAIKAAEAQVAK